MRMPGSLAMTPEQNQRTKMDAVIREAKKAYRASHQKRLDDLLAERSKWTRRHTIAENKLQEVNRDIAGMLQEVIREGMKS